MMAFTKPKGIKREQLSVVCSSLIPLTMKSFVMKSYGIIARYILNLVGLYNLSFKNQNYENCYPELANRCLEFLIAFCPYLRTIRDNYRRSCHLIFFKLVLSLLSLLIGAALI